MRFRLPQTFLVCALLCGTLCAQLQIRKVSEPSGNALDKALKATALIQPDSKPFTVKLTIAQTKGEPGPYDATVEETWVSPTKWVRKINATGLSQTIVVNATGTHITTSGDYFPEWLRSFVIGLFTPVPDVDVWDKLKLPLTHIELPNGGGSNPCMQQEFNLGAAPVVQINFEHVCFKNGLFEMVQSTNYSMGFSNYQKFGKLKVARTLTTDKGRIALTGTIVSLATIDTADPALFVTPADAGDKDPLASYIISTDQLTKLANGSVALPWPNPIPGHGMFTVWVSLDRNGVVREVHTLNSDESGFAYDMSQKLLGLHWKSPLMDGTRIQVQGALVFAYPPPPGPEETKPAAHE